MALQIIILISGLGILVAGAECLVRGGSSLARHLGLTPLVVGLTVVAFGTSAPEMAVSIGGALQGQGDIAVGNVVGSNIFNVGCILALAAILSPIDIKLGILKLDAPLVFIVSLLAVWMMTFDTLTRLTGLILILLLAGYTFWSIRLARRQTSEDIQQEFDTGVPRSLPSFRIDFFLIAGGLVLLVLGSKLLVDSAVFIARAYQVSDAVIALTIVSAGTSMPEFSTSLIAAFRGKSDIALGNILGSNLFNILGILGLSALARPINTAGVLSSDLWIMAAFALCMLPLFWTGRKLQRWEGVLLLTGYAGYILYRWP